MVYRSTEEVVLKIFICVFLSVFFLIIKITFFVQHLCKTEKCGQESNKTHKPAQRKALGFYLENLPSSFS